MSLDFKLFMAFLGVAGILFVPARTLPLLGKSAVLSSLAVAFVGISIRHRRVTRWQWPGVGVWGIVKAALTVLGGVMFLWGSGSQVTVPFSLLFPWLAGGAATCLLIVLQQLNVSPLSLKEYTSHCRPPQTGPDARE